MEGAGSQAGLHRHSGDPYPAAHTLPFIPQPFLYPYFYREREREHMRQTTVDQMQILFLRGQCRAKATERAKIIISSCQQCEQEIENSHVVQRGFSPGARGR